MIKYLAREKATGKLVEARGQDVLFAGIFYDTLLCWYVGSENGPYFNVLYTDFSSILMLLSKQLWGIYDI